jgi:hypothetical protein
MKARTQIVTLKRIRKRMGVIRKLPKLKQKLTLRRLLIRERKMIHQMRKTKLKQRSRALKQKMIIVIVTQKIMEKMVKRRKLKVKSLGLHLDLKGDQKLKIRLKRIMDLKRSMSRSRASL